MINFNLNFGGFYESIHDQIVENAMGYYFDFVDHETGEIDKEKMWFIGADIWEFGRIKYSKSFLDVMNDTIGTDLKFEVLYSPNFYNYETDQIICNISKKDILKVFDFIKKENLKNKVFSIIKEKTTSYDGFIAFYYYEDFFKKENLSFLIECLFDVILKNEDFYLDEFYIVNLPEIITDKKGYMSLKNEGL